MCTLRWREEKEESESESERQREVRREQNSFHPSLMRVRRRVQKKNSGQIFPLISRVMIAILMVFPPSLPLPSFFILIQSEMRELVSRQKRNIECLYNPTINGHMHVFILYVRVCMYRVRIILIHL